MHIPDGFINNSVSAPLIGAAVLSVGYSVSKLKSGLLKKKIVAKKKLALETGDLDTAVEEKWQLTDKGKDKLLAIASTGAFVFAAQMMNFPVAEGTSGHLIGAALSTIVLGPYVSILIMALVLSVQALMFGDGGLVALGANIVNLGIVASFTAYFVYKYLFNSPKGFNLRFLLAGFLSAWLSVIAAALFCSLQLIVSGHGGAEILASMLGVHALIGIGEAVITVAVVLLFFPKKLNN
jgi:cobalt/nickel transport system permease protein